MADRQVGPERPASPQSSGASSRSTAGDGDLVRGLDALGAASIIVGIIIGAAIFRIPGEVAAITQATGLVFVVFILAGLFVLLGALCYSELGAMMPKAGGPYVYFREAFGDMPAFLMGWASFVAILGASVAAVATFFGELGGTVFGYSGDLMINVVAAAAILLLAFTNILGVRLAGFMQIGFAAFKVAALGAVVVVGIYLGTGDPLTLTPTLPQTWDLGLLQVMGLALVPALFVYSGWANANNVAEEIRDPGRSLPRAVIGGVVFVIIVYLIANFAYLWALGLDGLAGAEDEAAADVFNIAFGDCIDVAGACIAPGQLITLIIFLSLFGSLNGMTISYPRIYYAMAKDGVFFPAAAHTHRRFKTPHWAIGAQAVWAIALVFWGNFERLAQLVVFASFLFYALAVLALMILRHRHPEWPRPFKVPLYPAIPILFIVGTVAFTVNLMVEDPRDTLLGLAVMLVGVPVFYLARRFFVQPPSEDPTRVSSLAEEDVEGPL